jgi:hypothetical protein
MGAEQDEQDHEARGPKPKRRGALPKPRRSKSAGKEDKGQAHHDAMSPTAPDVIEAPFAVIRFEPWPETYGKCG